MPPGPSGASSAGLIATQGAKVPGELGDDGVNGAPALVGAEVGIAFPVPLRPIIAAARSLSSLSVVGDLLRLRAARV